MNKVLKLQRVGLINPTVVEYDGKILATNQLDIESTCNLWRCHFGFYPTEKIDLAMTKKNFSVIQQKTLSSVKSVYDLFYERNFIPRVFDSNEEVSNWDMYRTNEVEKLKTENATLRERLDKAIEPPCERDDIFYRFFQYPAEMVEDIACGFRKEKDGELYVCSANSESWYNVKECEFSREAAEARLKELQGGEG